MVYFIQGTITKLVKIGRTKGSVRARLNALESPDILVCLKVAVDLEERGLHDKFRASWSHGEWFKPDEELMGFIAQLPVSEFDGMSQERRSPWKGRRVVVAARRSKVLYERFNGSKLRLLREGLAKSRTWLGKKVKASSTQVGKWEDGEAKPHLMMVQRIARALAVRAASLMEK